MAEHEWGRFNDEAGERVPNAVECRRCGVRRGLWEGRVFYLPSEASGERASYSEPPCEPKPKEKEADGA